MSLREVVDLTAGVYKYFLKNINIRYNRIYQHQPESSIRTRLTSYHTADAIVDSADAFNNVPEKHGIRPALMQKKWKQCPKCPRYPSQGAMQMKIAMWHAVRKGPSSSSHSPPSIFKIDGFGEPKQGAVYNM